MKINYCDVYFILCVCFFFTTVTCIYLFTVWFVNAVPAIRLQFLNLGYSMRGLLVNKSYNVTMFEKFGIQNI